MIKYKLLETEEEAKKMDLYLMKKGINGSRTGITFLAINEDAQIVGVCTLENIVFIQPFASENALVANKLLTMLEGVIVSKQISAVRCNTRTANKELFTRLGFNEVYGNQVTLEKIY